MKNNWSKKIAKKYIKKYKKLGFSSDLALRVYSTRLLGRNKELVLHGGGNTSVKTKIKDIDGKNSPLETFTSCLAAFKLALSALSFELFLKASDKVLTKSSA